MEPVQRACEQFENLNGRLRVQCWVEDQRVRDQDQDQDQDRDQDPQLKIEIKIRYVRDQDQDHKTTLNWISAA